MDLSFQSKNRRLFFLALFAIASSLILKHLPGVAQAIGQLPLIGILLIGGIPLLTGIAKQLWIHEMGADLLAGVSIISAALMGEYLVGSVIVLMLSGGRALEEYAARKASSALEAIAKRAPSVAHLVIGNEVRTIRAEEIQPGQTLSVFPHEICPVDGIVAEGHGSMDESYLTGEPYQMAKAPGSAVLSGAINGASPLLIRALRKSDQSRYAQITKVMRQSEQSRPRMRRIGDRIAAWYAPLSLSLASLAWLIGGTPSRFLAVIVVATPCPLILAIPVAVIGAISASARRGIVIKDPKGLEQASQCKTFMFDKTGTLTYGRPQLTDVDVNPGFGRTEVLQLAISLEKFSKHPLAEALVRAGKAENISPVEVREIQEKPGEGLRGQIAGRDILITGRSKAAKYPGPLPPSLPGLESFLIIDGSVAAVFRFLDAPREESADFIAHLHPKHAAGKMILLSGDRGSEVKYLAEVLGIHDVYYEKTPEEKVAVVKKETAANKTLYLGDGINDAPALMQATVGVAFGKGDIVAESADAVIMEPSLLKVDEFIHIASRMRRFALQSAVGGIALSLVGMILAAGGHLSPIYGVLTQETIDLAAILNALRAAYLPRALADF